MEAEHFAELEELNWDYWWFATRFEAVWRLATRALRQSPTSIVDLGCGTGMFLSWLLEKKRIDKSHLLGLDASKLGLAAASRRGVPVRPLDLSRMDLRSVVVDAPDMFTMLDVLEHLPTPVVSLSAVRKASKPGGILVVTVPALPLLWSGWDDRLGHYRRYTPATLKADLIAAGWHVCGLQYLFFGMLVPALLRRVLSRSARPGDPGFPRVSATTNSILSTITRAEARLGRLLPSGTSLVAAAQCRTHTPAAEEYPDQADEDAEYRLDDSSR